MDIDEEEHRCILAQDITGELSLKILTQSEACVPSMFFHKVGTCYLAKIVF
jgi:hypothetical protein